MIALTIHISCNYVNRAGNQLVMLNKSWLGRVLH